MAKPIHDVPDDYLKCAALGHRWDTFAPLKRNAAWGTLVSLRCDRCGMERFDTIDSIGALSVRSYERPPGYSPKDWMADRADMRKELMNRMRTKRAVGRQARLKSVG